MNNKYKVGEIVRMREGYSDNPNDSSGLEYGGAGYISNISNEYRVCSIEEGAGMWDSRLIYFVIALDYDDYSGGVVEDVLIGLDEIRDIKLEKLGIKSK